MRRWCINVTAHGALLFLDDEDRGATSPAGAAGCARGSHAWRLVLYIRARFAIDLETPPCVHAAEILVGISPFRRLIGIALAVTVCLGLWGCGKDAGSVKPALSGAGTRSGLGTKRFNALDRTFAALLPLERLRHEVVDATTFAVAARPAYAACDQVASVDALLRPIGRYCVLGLNLDEQIIVYNACVRAVTRHEPIASESACERSFAQIPSLVRRMRREARNSDRVIHGSALAPACRDALIVDARTYTLLNAYSRVFTALGRVRSRVDLRADLREALQRLDVLNAKIPPSVGQHRRELHTRCA
jgi:hypothetical protein